MKVYFSTVVRGAPIRKGGELVKLDWRAQRVEARVPIAPRNPEVVDPNPRGNTRGCRGVAVIGDDVIAASYHTLSIYDHVLVHRRDVTHPLFVGLHEVFPTARGTLWVTSTAIDAALEVDLSTGDVVREIWPREIPGFQNALGVQPLDVNKAADNRTLWADGHHIEAPSHLHLNAVAQWKGEALALFNRFGVIANLDTERIVLKDDGMRGGHNLAVDYDGTVAVNDSIRGAVRVYDLAEGRQAYVYTLREFPEVNRLVRPHDLAFKAKRGLRRLKIGLTPPRPLFVRGADRVGGLLFVGLSPAGILAIDERSRNVAGVFRYSKDVHVCVHGLRVLPDG